MNVNISSTRHELNNEKLWNGFISPYISHLLNVTSLRTFCVFIKFDGIFKDMLYLNMPQSEYICASSQNEFVGYNNNNIFI